MISYTYYATLNLIIIINYLLFILLLRKFGDWGLGIGDWAQSPIPNPQSPTNCNK